jgi:Transposase DDE domain
VRVGEHLDRAVGRERTEPVTIDLDATVIEVYGARKRGAARNRLGQLSYAPHVAFWAQRGRALTSELVGGNREKLTGAECARIATRALSLLAAGHGPAIFRIDSAYYQLELLSRLRRERARFTVSVPRSQAVWKALAEIGEDAWQDALDMPGAQVAQTTYRPQGWKHEPLRLIVRRVPFTGEQIAKLKGLRRLTTIHPDQLQLALDGEINSVYGYSFILTDIHWQPAVWIEHFHRDRAQIEERLKESKLGQALRHLPSGDEHANRVWLTAALLALNLTAFCCDLCPAARRVRQGTRRRAAAPRRQNASQPHARHSRADRAHRPAADPPPTSRLPPQRRPQSDTRRDLQAWALMSPEPAARRRPPRRAAPPTPATPKDPRIPHPSKQIRPTPPCDAHSPHSRPRSRQSNRPSSCRTGLIH